jgi:hypothetical protein
MEIVESMFTAKLKRNAAWKYYQRPLLVIGKLRNAAAPLFELAACLAG